MPFLEHFRELRYRLKVSLAALLVGGVIGYLAFDTYSAWFTRPLGDQPLYVRGIADAFNMKMQLALYVGLALSAPVHVYNVVAFILPALTGRERRWLWLVLGAAVPLGLLGGSFGYFYVVPTAVRFLLSPELMPKGVQVWLDYKDNYLYALRLSLGFAVLFQFPILLETMLAMGLVTRQTLLNYGRLVVVLIFVAAAIFAPPDAWSMVALALPLIALYYLSILVAKVFHLGDTPAD